MRELRVQQKFWPLGQQLLFIGLIKPPILIIISRLQIVSIWWTSKKNLDVFVSFFPLQYNITLLLLLAFKFYALILMA